MSDIRWTEQDMIAATAAHFDWERADCRVVRHDDGRGGTCLVVLHVPSGRTSAEAGDGGRWHLDGTGY
jgi:hypothetical protein